MIHFRHTGDFSKLTRFMERAKEAVRLGDLNKYGRAGVAALSSATPVDSGETAASWYYEITNKNNTITISFHNSNIQNGVPIAILLQYGHGTGTGGWVQGRDYINPAIQPIFDQILQPLDLMIHQREYGVSHYLRQMDNFTIFASSKRKLRKLIRDIQAWLADVGLKLKDNWQVFRIGFTPRVEKAREHLPEVKRRRRRPRIPSALGYRFGHGYTILRKHNLFRLKQTLHLYYYRRDRNRVISFKRASGLISRLGQLRKCDCQRILERYYQPKTMFDLKKVVRKECRRLQKLYPPYQAA